jgi:hypothetical protein
MTRREIDAAIGRANPVRREALEPLPLQAAEHDLLAAIAAHPREPEPHRARRRAPRWAPIGLAGAAAAVATGLVLAGAGADPSGRPESAFAADIARMAKTSPVVVIDRSWRPRPSAPRHVKAKARPKGETTAWVYDCTKGHCVKRAYVKAVAAGLVPDGIDPRDLPKGAKLVIAPHDDH